MIIKNASIQLVSLADWSINGFVCVNNETCQWTKLCFYGCS